MTTVSEKTVSGGKTMRVHVADELHWPVVQSVRRYRDALRKMFAALDAGHALAATLAARDDGSCVLTPHNDEAKIALAVAFGGARIKRLPKALGPNGKPVREGSHFDVAVGSASAYELRNWFRAILYPSAKSFVWDSARALIVERWRALDPEVRATRGFLTMQGARQLAQFWRRGMCLPLATARPRFARRSVTVHWDNALGPVELQLADLDRGAWKIWRRIRDGVYEPGSITINERAGKLLLGLSYKSAAETAETDADAVLTVRLDGDRLTMTADASADEIALDNAIAVLTRLRGATDAWTRRRASSGSSWRSWGHRAKWRGAQEHLTAVTASRANFVTDCCHAWARRVASRARSWKCGQVALEIDALATLAGHSFPWSELKCCVQYKLARFGGSLTM